jgi:hypothetical protein
MIRFLFILYRLSFRRVMTITLWKLIVCLKMHAIAAFKQRGAADFPTPGNSSLAGIMNAARQFHVRRASADATPYPTLNSTVQPSDNELNTRQIVKSYKKEFISFKKP